MKNLHIEYQSGERTPVVQPAFAELLPPVPDDQLEVLEKDLLGNGCLSPIIVNEDMVVIDGHHRLRICEKHGIPYRMAVFSFENDLEAKQYALDIQRGRRNLDTWKLAGIAMKLKPDIEAKAKENSGTRTDLSQNSDEGFVSMDTRQILADVAGISRDSMSKAMRIESDAPDSVKDALNEGRISLNQGFNITKELDDVAEEDKERVAAEAIEREVAKKKNAGKNRQPKPETVIAKQYEKAFEQGLLLNVSEENTEMWAKKSKLTRDLAPKRIAEAMKIAEQFMKITDILDSMLKDGALPETAESEDANPDGEK